MRTLRWPAEESEREQCRRRREPRLLLVERDTLPPSSSDILEDWVRLPVGRVDVEKRIENLRSRARSQLCVTPRITADRTLEFCGTSTPLAEIDARILEALVESFGSVVSRVDLVERGWQGERNRPNVLDLRINRLRRVITGTGLWIRTHHCVGYSLAPE